MTRINNRSNSSISHLAHPSHLPFYQYLSRWLDYVADYNSTFHHLNIRSAVHSYSSSSTTRSRDWYTDCSTLRWGTSSSKSKKCRSRRTRRVGRPSSDSQNAAGKQEECVNLAYITHANIQSCPGLSKCNPLKIWQACLAHMILVRP